MLLVMLAASLWGQDSLTTISDVVHDGSGAGVTGTCTYTAATGRFLGAALDQIVGEPVVVPITAGIFFAKLVPTDTALPVGQYYQVVCAGNRGWKLTGYWLVPTSGSPLRLKDIWASTAPSPGILIPPPQISALGLTSGTYCFAVVNGVVQPALVACSAGGGTTTFDLAPGLFDSAPGLFDAH